MMEPGEYPDLYTNEHLDTVDAMLEEGDKDAKKVWQDAKHEVTRFLFKLFRRTA